MTWGRNLLLILLSLFYLSAFALELKPDAPTRYVVQNHDTLWDIANRFLVKPWEWQTLWSNNPFIKNPRHLYAGAVLRLGQHKGKPYLRVLSNGRVKLSPSARPKPLAPEVPPIPLAELNPFFSGEVVLDQDTLSGAPFIMAFTTEHMLGGQGDEVYVRNLCPNFKLPPGVIMTYAIYRPGGKYLDPDTGFCLGYKASLVGYAQLIRGGDPATILLTDIFQGVHLTDKVMPNNYPGFKFDFLPKTPIVPVIGKIIDVADDFTQGAVGLVVVINRGKMEGMEPGDVLGVFKEGSCITPCCEQFPSERLGEVMIFRTFTHTSLALIVRSVRSITLGDVVTNP